MFKFEVFENMRNIKDSMQLDSGTDICRLTTDHDTIEIRVQGFVTVDFKGDRYTRPSEFPDELKELIEREPNTWSVYAPSGEGNDDYDGCYVYVDENNWFEIFWNNGSSSDVVDIEGYTEEQLLGLCIEMLDAE